MSSKRGSGRPKAPVHKHFEREPSSPDNNPLYICNHCTANVRGKKIRFLYNHIINDVNCPISKEQRAEVREEYDARLKGINVDDSGTDASVCSDASNVSKKRKEASGPLDHYDNQALPKTCLYPSQEASLFHAKCRPKSFPIPSQIFLHFSLSRSIAAG